MTDDQTVRKIVDAVQENFPTFGNEGEGFAHSNPIAVALAEQPSQFAMGVSVEDVVRFVLKELERSTGVTVESTGSRRPSGPYGEGRPF